MRRMWAAAAKIDLNNLYQDLEQDKLIKAKLSKLTGIPADQIGVAPDPAEGQDGGAGGDFCVGDGGFGDADEDDGSDESDSSEDNNDSKNNKPENNKPKNDKADKADDKKPGKGFGGGSKEESGVLARMTDHSGRIRRVPLLAREFPDGEVRAKSKTGKDKWVYNQKAASETINRSIVKAAVELARNPSRKQQVLGDLRRKIGRIPKLV